MTTHLEAIRTRAERATAGPWFSTGYTIAHESGPVADVSVWGIRPDQECEANAQLIAAARTDIPRLCAQLAEARRIIKAHVVWHDTTRSSPCECPECVASRILLAALDAEED